MIGFSADIDTCLLNAADMTNNPLNRYVTLVIDEVHIKEDLVYDKYQGHLIGFVDLGNILVQYCHSTYFVTFVYLKFITSYDTTRNQK